MAEFYLFVFNWFIKNSLFRHVLCLAWFQAWELKYKWDRQTDMLFMKYASCWLIDWAQWWTNQISVRWCALGQWLLFIILLEITKGKSCWWGGQWVKVSPSKPDNLSLIPRTHVMAEENWLPQHILWHHTRVTVLACPSHTHKHT